MENLINNVITINGKPYYDIQTFADLTNRSAQSVRLLIGKGNRFRKIDHLKLGRALYIAEHELVDFPFACAGRSKMVLRYDDKANERAEFIT